MHERNVFRSTLSGLSLSAISTHTTLISSSLFFTSYCSQGRSSFVVAVLIRLPCLVVHAGFTATICRFTASPYGFLTFRGTCRCSTLTSFLRGSTAHVCGRSRASDIATYGSCPFLCCLSATAIVISFGRHWRRSIFVPRLSGAVCSAYTFALYFAPIATCLPT